MSSKLNRLLRGVIAEFRNQLVSTQGGSENVTPDAVKTMLCYICKDYPRDDLGLPLSFTKITNKEGSLFLEWIFSEGGQRGFTFNVIEQEWLRVINQIRN